jgi:hypothetical protein
MISAAPARAPYPVEEFFKLSPRELAMRAWNSSKDAIALPCSVPVRIGLFFDGTNNNLARDRNGERVNIGGKETTGGTKKLPGAECSHSNIARLFQAFRANSYEKGIFSYYIPGVGTRFKEIGELTESSEGKAFAKGGQARIVFALLQVINAIYSVILRKQLFSDKEAGAIAQTYEHAMAKLAREKDGDHVSAHAAFFQRYLGMLKTVALANPKPSIPAVTLDVFGFSRGAAQAVAFCHMFDEILADGKIATIPATINFLGIFDTVASVGLSASVSMTTILPEVLADGHFAWAGRIKKPLPASVRTGRHYIAAHEQRMNFPVTNQSGPADFKEVYFPGVHSDVGGGYNSGAGGKGRGGQASMLSQIPLACMYREACIEGVPFKMYEELDDAVKDDFAISPELASAWDAYSEGWKAQQQDFANSLRNHMSMYYYWRASRLDDIERTVFFKSADRQAQQDLSESNQVLKGDLEMIKQRDVVRYPGDPAPNITEKEAKTISQWHVIRANTGLNAWEKWAVSCFKKPKILSSEVTRFFDDYVHDSIAGFYLAGEVTEYDKRVKVASVMNMSPRQRNNFDKKIFELTKQVNEAAERKKRGEELSPSEAALVKEAENGTPYPIMTDDDAKDMGAKAIRTQTSSRREGGGYLLKRKAFPKDDEPNEVAQSHGSAQNSENSAGKAAA